MSVIFLAIETSTTNCSVAVLNGAEVIAANEVNDGYKHAELIYGMVEACLKEAQINVDEINALVVGKGPGSYTGLRIGASFIKGLAFAQSIPVIAINSLENLAHHPNAVAHDGLVVPMIDARRMEVYDAIYSQGECILSTRAEVLDASSFSAEFKAQKVLFIGDGAEKCKALFKEQTNASFAEEASPSAIHIGALALKKYEAKAFEDVAYFEPYYLKDFIAGKPKKLL